MLSLLKLEDHVLAKLLVVLSELELFTSSEILLLNVCDVSHDP